MPIERAELDELESFVAEQFERHYVTKKPKWYELNAAQWVTVAVVILGGLVSIVKYEERLEQHEKRLAELEVTFRAEFTTVNSLAQSIALDHASLLVLTTRQEKIDASGSQIAVMNSQLEQVRRTVDSLSAKVDSVSSVLTTMQIDFSRQEKKP